MFAVKSHLSSFEVQCNVLPQAAVPIIDLETQAEPAPHNSKEDVEKNLVIKNDGISSSDNLFANMNFIIIGFGEKDSKILSALIETHSGVISIQKNTLCDIAVVPIIWHDLNIPVSNIVTNCWLQKCIEESKIFDFDENELFRPFAIDTGKKAFESFVISFSQYVGSERDCLMQLAESLGATCQEYFVRKANAAKGLLLNTHLVVSFPNGSKYEASKKWKIPAVTKQWIIDSAMMGVAPPVDEYLVEKSPGLPSSDESSMTVQDVSLSREINKGGNISNVQSEQKNIPQSKCVAETSSQNNEISFKAFTSEQNTNCIGNTESIENDIAPETKKRDNEFPSAPLQHNRITELCNDSRRENINKYSPIRPPTADSSFDASLNLDQSSNFNFHVSGILQDLDVSNSRESLGGSDRQSFSIEEMFTRNLASFLQRLDIKRNLETDSDSDSEVFEENDSGCGNSE